MTRYTITNFTFLYHYNAICEDTGQKYYVHVPFIAKGDTPELSVHRGTNKNGPRIGLVYYPSFTNSWKVAFCNQQDPEDVEWEDMTCVKRCNNAKWRWTVTAPPRHVGEAPQRRTFLWTRTRNVGVDGTKPSKRTERHWKLREEGATGREDYVAVFTGDPARGKCGTLVISDGFDNELDEKIFVSLIGLYEKARTYGGA